MDSFGSGTPHQLGEDFLRPITQSETLPTQSSFTLSKPPSLAWMATRGVITVYWFEGSHCPILIPFLHLSETFLSNTSLEHPNFILVYTFQGPKLIR